MLAANGGLSERNVTRRRNVGQHRQCQGDGVAGVAKRADRRFDPIDIELIEESAPKALNPAMMRPRAPERADIERVPMESLGKDSCFRVKVMMERTTAV